MTLGVEEVLTEPPISPKKVRPLTATRPVGLDSEIGTDFHVLIEGDVLDGGRVVRDYHGNVHCSENGGLL